MQDILQKVNDIFSSIVPISDFFWDFPTNIGWYAKIPIIGNFSLPIIMLLGMGIYFSFKTSFIQKESFRHAIKIMLHQQKSDQGVSAIGAFMLGLAMRAGPGNIVGVTGAISVGGPGALFWMWVSALFGMATAFIEATLSQIFKQKKYDEYVGGLPFYGEKILGGKRFIGIFLSLMFIIYAFLNVPSQTFNVFSAVDMLTKTITGVEYSKQSSLYYGFAIGLWFFCALIILGGIKRVVAYSNILVPIKAICFIGFSLFIIIINFHILPYFFYEVIKGAFSPHAIFGGSMGIALVQGIKRGLMTNEAGQGTITMAAGVARNNHPCEQGYVQSLGVFADTMIICTLTGFIVIMAHLWTGYTVGAEWEAIKASKIGFYLASVKSLVPVSIANTMVIILALCYGLFAFTTLLGMISFAEISANFISKNKYFILSIRIIGSFILVPFGTLTLLAGLELGNIWYLTDLTNIVMVYINIPILLLGAPLVYKALQNYRQNPTKRFKSEDIGLVTEYWK